MKYPMQKSATIVFIILLFVFSCKNDSYYLDRLKKVQAQVQDNPTIALSILDSIQSPESMSEDNYMWYILLRQQAKYDSKHEFLNDTLIFDAQRYFNNKNDIEKAAIANFYSGTVYWVRKMPDDALNSFLMADKFAQQVKNNIISAKSQHFTGYLYLEQNVLDSAIIRFKNALKYYNLTDKFDFNKLQVLSLIGRSYEASDNLDSAYYYFRKCLDLASEKGNKEYQASQTYNLGYIYLRKNEYQKAENYLDDALKLTTNTEDSLKIYLNYSLLYNKTRQLDLAKHYIELINEQLSEIRDNYLLESVYGSISEYYMQIGNDKLALHYKDLQKKVSQKIFEARNLENLLNAESNYKLYIEKQKRKSEREYLLLIQIIIILIIVAAFYFITIKRRHKHQKKIIENRRLKVENRLLKQEHDSHIYLESIYQQYILKWAKIENRVNKLGVEDEQVDLPLYTEIKSMSDELKSYTNKQLIKLAKSYLHSHSDIGEKAVRVLTEQELLLMILCYFEYSKVAIATILDIKLEKLDLEERKLRIATRLKRAGMADYDINLILYSEKM